MNKGTGCLPAGSDSAFFITHKPSSWVNPSPLWEVSLLLALLTLHRIKPESYISAFSYIYVTRFFLIRCEWYYYCRTELQSMNFFFPHLSAKIVIFDMPWIMNGEYITYTFIIQNVRFLFCFPVERYFYTCFLKKMFVLCLVCTFNRLELE